ncbi:copper resistance protein CopC [Mycolicibacterium chlorophenolicum]|uniref:Copper resistance protein CopC n=1 Tax=Mycolicibacterium chlorophenolicum TaxID=37916 RepID=A0A0J6VVL5_9MYCO|nr:copper resistance protein CopC [Mycolicibacterium chlorophenolicum]KMO73462.1 Copper resistance protein CopC [Mycolicibacterium chlorophenolicum]
MLLDENGRTVATSQATTSDGAQVVTAHPAAPVPPGSYTVRWRVTGTDGDLVEEEFRFGVGYALTAAAASAGTASTAWWSAALRWVLFAGFAIAVGGLIAQRSIAQRAPRSRGWRRRGHRSSVLWRRRWQPLWAWPSKSSQRPGRLALCGAPQLEAVGVVAALALTRMHAQTWALVPLLAIVGAEGWRSHAHSAAGWWGAVLTAVHLAAAAVWVGALVTTTLAVLSWRDDGAAVRWVLHGYMRLAAWTFVIALGTGVLSALVLLPLSQVFSTT